MKDEFKRKYKPEIFSRGDYEKSGEKRLLHKKARAKLKEELIRETSAAREVSIGGNGEFKTSTGHEQAVPVFEYVSSQIGSGWKKHRRRSE